MVGIDRVRKVRDVNGDGRKPLWVTEIGIRSPDEVGPGTTQASLLLGLFDVLEAQPDVAGTFVYRLADQDGSPWPLTNLDFVPRPDFERLRAGLALRPQAPPPVPTTKPKPKGKLVRRCTGKGASRRCRTYRCRTARDATGKKVRRCVRVRRR